MTDHTELKRLAEAAQEDPDSPYLPCPVAFMNAATPSVVLALIAENKELGRYLCTCRDCGGEGAIHTGDWHSYSPMEPPEPVMEKCGECDGTGLLGEIQDLYQVITERDQLRAENAGLQTGYKAYEQVNAELKAEVEALRREREGKVLCDLELFQGLRDTASQEAEEHRQHMAAYRPLRQQVLDYTVRQCDALIDAALGQGERS